MTGQAALLQTARRGVSLIERLLPRRRGTRRTARQLRETGFDRDFLIRAVATLRRDGDRGAADRLRFKHVRAKFKHFRYAHALYGTGSSYPPMLDRITITIGHLQDGFRNGRRGAVMLHASLLRIWLAPPFVARLRHEAGRQAAVTTAGFRRLLETDRTRLAAFVAGERVTGRELHAAREIVGRQVSFYDTLRTLRPSHDSVRMSRSLSAINGHRKPPRHARHSEGRVCASYDDIRFALSDPIRDRPAALVDCGAAD